MPSKLLGNNYMLWVESATPGTYNVVLGQGALSIARSATKIDLSTKDDGGYAASAYGLRDLVVSFECEPKLPDTTGYTRLETQCLANPPAPLNVQIRKGGTGGLSADAVLTASVYGNLDSSDMPQNGPVKVKVSLVAAAAPTLDTLA